MALDKINMFAQAFTGGAGKVGGIQPQVSPPIAPTSQVGANPFAGKNKDDGAVGLGIADGAVQTSAAQMGKKPAEMRQLGIG